MRSRSAGELDQLIRRVSATRVGAAAPSLHPGPPADVGSPDSCVLSLSPASPLSDDRSHANPTAQTAAQTTASAVILEGKHAAAGMPAAGMPLPAAVLASQPFVAASKPEAPRQAVTQWSRPDRHPLSNPLQMGPSSSDSNAMLTGSVATITTLGSMPFLPAVPTPLPGPSSNHVPFVLAPPTSLPSPSCAAGPLLPAVLGPRPSAAEQAVPIVPVFLSRFSPRPHGRDDVRPAPPTIRARDGRSPRLVLRTSSRSQQDSAAFTPLPLPPPADQTMSATSGAAVATADPAPPSNRQKASANDNPTTDGMYASYLGPSQSVVALLDGAEAPVEGALGSSHAAVNRAHTATAEAAAAAVEAGVGAVTEGAGGGSTVLTAADWWPDWCCCGRRLALAMCFSALALVAPLVLARWFLLDWYESLAAGATAELIGYPLLVFLYGTHQRHSLTGDTWLECARLNAHRLLLPYSLLVGAAAVALLLLNVAPSYAVPNRSVWLLVAYAAELVGVVVFITLYVTQPCGCCHSPCMAAFCLACTGSYRGPALSDTYAAIPSTTPLRTT
jgi:hypothetical protein